MAELTIELLSPEPGMAVRQDSGGLSATLLKKPASAISASHL